jgi:hypothetical protein
MTSKPGSGPAGMNTSVKIGAAAFIMAVVILLGLMLVSGLLTVVLESGSYERISVDGRVLITPGSYQVVEKPNYPFWRWFTAPVEILFTEGNVTLITLILFLFAVGGSITILEQIHVMDMLIQILIDRFKASRYLLMGVVILLFMALPSLLGIYEGLVPVIIFVVPMARRLGWDSLTGLGMSLLPMAFGLSAAISNPFTIAVAQTIADLPIFSGAWLRIIFFVLVYAAVYGFVYRHARKVEEDPGRSIIYQEDRKLEIRESKSFEPEQAKQVRRGLTWFSVWIGIALLVVLSVAFFPDLGFLAFPLMGLMFLIGGFGAGVLSGYRFSRILGIFLAGGEKYYTRSPSDHAGILGQVHHRFGYGHRHSLVHGRRSNRTGVSVRLSIPGLPDYPGDELFHRLGLRQSIPDDAHTGTSGGPGRHYPADGGAGIRIRRRIQQYDLPYQPVAAHSPEFYGSFLCEMDSVDIASAVLYGGLIADIYVYCREYRLRTILDIKCPENS